jgi:hypothetical protein
MRRAHSLALAPFFFLVVFVSTLRADHQDDRVGFKISTPKEWSQIPQTLDERWIVGKYVSPKSNYWTDKATGWTAEHKPDMEMIAFVSDALKERIKVQKQKDKSGNETTIISIDNPYKDYKDFMTRRYSGGGWFISKQEDTKVGDVPVTCYEIKVEKMSQQGPKRILTWVYHVPDIDIAVQFEVLEDAFPKLQNELQRCFKSFKPVKRNGESLADVSTGDGGSIHISFDKIEKMTPDDRKKERIALERAAHEKAAKTAPEGWTVKEMGHFLVISHADDKFVKRVVERAEAAWKWLDDTFPFVGEKEYVRSPVLRICKDQPEYEAFHKNSQGSWTSVEITTYDDQGGTTSWAMEEVNREVKNLWFNDRDSDLAGAMPMWLSQGLDHLIGMAAVKQGRLEFRTDDWNRDEVRQAVREKTALAPKAVMSMDGESFWQDFIHAREGAALVGFLTVGPGSKDKQTKDVLVKYLKSLKAVATEVRTEAEKDANKGAANKEAETEEEEDRQLKDRNASYKAKQKHILDETMERTFHGWSDADWKRFEDMYFKTIG